MKVLTNNILLPQEPCLTEDELIRYANAICDRDEARQFDAHLSICPMCSDAVDGIMSVPFSDAENALKNIAKKTTPVSPVLEKTPIATPKPTEKTSETPVLQPRSRARFWLTAAAATVGLAGGSVFLLTQSEPQPPTLNNGMTAAETAQQATENAPKTANLPTDLRKDSLKNLPPSSADSLGLIANGEVTVSVESPQNYDVATALPPRANEDRSNSKDKSEEKAFGTPTKTPAPTTPSSSTESTFADNNVESESQKTARMRPTQSPNNAVGSVPRVESRNSENAVVLPSKKSSGFDATASLQQGMAFFRRGKYVNAIQEFEAVIEHQRSGEVYEMALWYLAESRFNAGRRIEARETWERIVAEKGSFAPKAAERLKK